MGDPLKFHEMTDEDLLEFVRGLYERDGIDGLSYARLRINHTLYTTLYHRGFRQSTLLERLGLMEHYQAWKSVQPIKHGNAVRQRWTWARVVEEARQVKLAEGFLPPAAWFQAKGRTSLVQGVYGHGRAWDDLDDFQGSQFVQSRNGMRWLSHAEASLSNFLYARGIPHRRGDRYPAVYGHHHVDYRIRLHKSAFGVIDVGFRSIADQSGNIVVRGQHADTARPRGRSKPYEG
jgi:hypothetical protein